MTPKGLSINPQTNPAALRSALEALAVVPTLADIMATVRRAAREVGGAQGATFVLREGELCFYADEDAISALWKGRRFQLESCVSGWSMLNRKAAIIPDIYRDPRVPVDAYRATFVKSMVMVPIRIDDPIGAIGAYWSSPFIAPVETLGALQQLADGAAAALLRIGYQPG